MEELQPESLVTTIIHQGMLLLEKGDKGEEMIHLCMPPVIGDKLDWENMENGSNVATWKRNSDAPGAKVNFEWLLARIGTIVTCQVRHEGGEPVEFIFRESIDEDPVRFT